MGGLMGEIALRQRDRKLFFVRQWMTMRSSEVAPGKIKTAWVAGSMSPVSGDRSDRQVDALCGKVRLASAA